ncbi:MAG: hypothetical protein FMNOHCHN_02030 [Ignavibacteriaceae bacterium]|nr:hypothetical protein [Ignavibacteriaceae bacterium]
MRIEEHKNLILNLDVSRKRILTKRNSWKRFEDIDENLRTLNNLIFKEESNDLILTRDTVFDEKNINIKLLLIYYWGFPRGGRKNYFKNYMSIHAKIIKIFEEKGSNNIDLSKVLFKELKPTGIGISTLSKLLYFCKFTINNRLCLILDERILSVIKADSFAELSNLSLKGDTFDTYKNYVETIHKLADRIEAKPDQIELFLFLFRDFTDSFRKTN